MDKKIGHHSALLQHVGAKAAKEKRGSGRNHAPEHEHDSQAHKKAPSRNTTRSHAHRAMSRKGNEHGAEELDHHDLHEESERAQESYEVRKTVQQEKDKDDNDESKNKQNQNQQLLLNRLRMRQAGNLLSKKAKPKVEPEQVKRAKRDGFESITKKQKLQAQKTKNASMEVPQGLRIPPQDMTTPTHYLLRDVRDEGEFFDQIDENGSHGSGEQGEQPEEEEIDPEWLAAVAELGGQLQGVRGVTSVTRGLSDDDQHVVLVITASGLTTSTFERLIPHEVRGYATLVAIPFDALPLRRERPALP